MTQTTTETQAPSLPITQRIELSVGDGAVKLLLDPEAFDFHLDVAWTAPQRTLLEMTQLASRFGFTVMDHDEAPFDYHGDFFRAWLTPTVPVDA